jgi:hypothetical protein
MLILALAALVLGAIPGAIASYKGYSIVLWWAFGAVLFPIVLPLALSLTTTAKALRSRELGRKRQLHIRECPACAEDIPVLAPVCHHCQSNVMPAGDLVM